jgi:hypothetical protein
MNFYLRFGNYVLVYQETSVNQSVTIHQELLDLQINLFLFDAYLVSDHLFDVFSLSLLFFAFI